MDVNKARDLIEKIDDMDWAEQSEYQKAHKIKIIESMDIIAEYDNDEDTDFACEHDLIWFGQFEDTVSKMSEEEVIKLRCTGWYENEDSWSHFAKWK